MLRQQKTVTYAPFNGVGWKRVTVQTFYDLKD